MPDLITQDSLFPSFRFTGVYSLPTLNGEDETFGQY
jgi:hypothetical protein